MTVKRSTQRVSKETYDAILALDKALRREFDCDTAYSIAGNGQVLAASNLKQGRIIPIANTYKRKTDIGIVQIDC